VAGNPSVTSVPCRITFDGDAPSTDVVDDRQYGPRSVTDYTKESLSPI
jgi:hypothetical protein